MGELWLKWAKRGQKATYNRSVEAFDGSGFLESQKERPKAAKMVKKQPKVVK